MTKGSDSPGPETIETSGGITIKYLNRYLYSPSSPEAGAVRRANSLPQISGCIYLLASPLLFYGVKTLTGRLPEDSTIMFLELDPVLADFTEEIISQSDNPEAILIRSAVQLLQELDSMDLGKYREVKLVSLSGGLSLNSEAYSLCEKNAGNLIGTYWKNRATLIEMGSLWINNIFTNLQYLPESYPLGDLYTFKPAVVAGAGESLESSLDIISSQRPDIFLLAADTALPVLFQAGIIPDAVIALEAQHANIYDFFDCRNLPLICDLTCSPSLLHQYRGPLFFIMSSFAKTSLFTSFTEKGITLPGLPPLGSVGTAAVYTALRLTEGPVFITGLDFAFRPGKTHSRETQSMKNRLLKTSRIKPLVDFSHGFDHPVKKISGKQSKPLLTTPNLEVYARLTGTLEEKERIRDLGETGMKLPFSGTDTITTETGSGSRTAEFVPASSARKEMLIKTLPDEKAIQDFINSEKGNMEELLKEGYNWLSGSRDDIIREKIRNLIIHLDYLCIPFPDFNLKGNFTESYLKRLLTAAARLKNRIENIYGL